MAAGAWSSIKGRLTPGPVPSEIPQSRRRRMARTKPKEPAALTHIDAAGRPTMVDVSAKATTARVASAECRVRFPADVAAQLHANGLKSAKGGIGDTAIIAGTMAVKRTHEPQQIVGDLLQAEISEKQARSIRYQMTIAKLPLAKDITEFAFAGTPINEMLVRDLASGEFLAHQRNVVLVGGTGTGKTHLAIAMARACIRDGARARFYNVVDLVNRLEAEARAGRQGRIADELRQSSGGHPPRQVHLEVTILCVDIAGRVGDVVAARPRDRGRAGGPAPGREVVRPAHPSPPRLRRPPAVLAHRGEVDAPAGHLPVARPRAHG